MPRLAQGAAAWPVALRHLPPHAARQHRRDRVPVGHADAVGRAARRRAHARVPHPPLVGGGQRREVLRQLPPPGLLPVAATTASSSRWTSTATTTSRAIPSTRARTRRAATAAIAAQSFCLGCHERHRRRRHSHRRRRRVRADRIASAFIRPAGAIRSRPATPTTTSGRRSATSSSASRCHRQETCLQCHATNGSAAGGAGKMWVNPHPPDWRGSPRCQALARSQRARLPALPRCRAIPS